MRNLPKSVFVGGQRFSIVVQELDKDCYGEMRFDDKRIVINPSVLAKRSTLRSTLRHEVLHAALHMAGVSFSDKYDEENVVRAIENIFFPAWTALHKKLETP
jgi:predicted metal-dependent peptidase